nr:RNA-directed DNA polymerase, eukaryota, reverse transcriptase zinc-binding domain protein [Tanacetum cinerariifolium]
MDAYISLKLSKNGKRFGFVRFLGIFNAEEFVKRLANIWIENFHLFAAVARFKRHDKAQSGKVAEVTNQPCGRVRASIPSKPALTAFEIYPHTFQEQNLLPPLCMEVKRGSPLTNNEVNQVSEDATSDKDDEADDIKEEVSLSNENVKEVDEFEKEFKCTYEKDLYKDKGKVSTHLDDELEEYVGNYSFDYACSLARGRSGGIISIWDPAMFIKINIWCGNHYVIVQGKWTNSDDMYFMINIYGPHDTHVKATLWNSLRMFIHTHNGKFMLFGDLNEATVLERGKSNHKSIFLHVEKLDYGPYQFKFFHSWLKRPDFDSMIKHVIEDLSTITTPLCTRLKNRLKVFKQKIKEWYHSTKHRKQSQRQILRNRINEIDQKLDMNVASDSDREERLNLIQECEELDHITGLDLAQKAHAQWDVEEKFQEHDSNVIFTDVPQFVWLTNNDRLHLDKDASSEEIKNAVWDCSSSKAPGPDGFSFLFLKSY